MSSAAWGSAIRLPTKPRRRAWSSPRISSGGGVAATTCIRTSAVAHGRLGSAAGGFGVGCGSALIELGRRRDRLPEQGPHVLQRAIGKREVRVRAAFLALDDA